MSKYEDKKIVDPELLVHYYTESSRHLVLGQKFKVEIDGEYIRIGCKRVKIKTLLRWYTAELKKDNPHWVLKDTDTIDQILTELERNKQGENDDK